MALSKITTASITDDAVTSAKIPNNAIGTTEVTDNAVTTAKITNANVSTAKLADDAVTQAKIGADAVGTTELANDVAISTSGAITTTGAFTSLGINDDADANVLTINSSEAVGIGKSLTLNNYTGYQVLTIGGSDATTGSVIDMENSAGLLIGQLNASSGRLHIGVDSLNANGGSSIRFEVDGSSKFEMGSENLTINDGNLVIGTAGHGISFAATAAGSGANQSELLDDYEEGTWTATLPVGGTISTSASYYVKVGAMVYAGAYINVSGQTNNGALWRIGGLPYAVKTGSHYHAAGSITYSHNTNTNNFMSPTPYSGGGSELYFHRNDGTATAITGSQAQSIDYLIFALVYITDS